MTLLYTLLGFLAILIPALAIQADLAGVVDWHKPLIGLPVLEPTPPSLVDTAAGRRVVGITKSNVLAVLNAETGDIGKLASSCFSQLTIAWRYKLEDVDPVVSYHVQDDCKFADH